MTRHRPAPDNESGAGALPVYRWKCAPDGLLTHRQLRARGLRPNGQPVAGVVRWRSRFGGTAEAHLYRPELAAPVREMTALRWSAIAAANRARRTCPTCRRDVGYVLPRHLGTCVPCADPADLAG